MLVVVLYAIAYSVVAVVVGSTVGRIAKQRSWTARRIYNAAYFGFYATVTAIVVVLEFLLRVDLPWPSSTLFGVAFIALFGGLAAYLAQRLCSATPAQS